MKTPPEEIDVRVLRLRPGDAVAVQFPGQVPPNVASAVGQGVRDALATAGFGTVPVLVLMNGVSLAVVRNETEVPADVAALVVAARGLMDAGFDDDFPREFGPLDKALEAFASRVPYENEPKGEGQ